MKISNFYQNYDFRNLEICEHSSFLIVDEIYYEMKLGVKNY